MDKTIEYIQRMLDSVRSDQANTTDRVSRAFQAGVIYAYENCLRKIQENG